jgi:hypothetical protein
MGNSQTAVSNLVRELNISFPPSISLSESLGDIPYLYKVVFIEIVPATP